MNFPEKCFKAYDIRGKYPNELNPLFAKNLGLGIIMAYKPQSIVIGHDARLSSPILENSLTEILAANGIDVTRLGLCGTEEIYHATAINPFDLGIMITGSHNPADENGFKLVRRGAIPISEDSGLKLLKEKCEEITQNGMGKQESLKHNGRITDKDLRTPYLNWLLDYSGMRTLKMPRKFRIVVNAGNGCAGLVMSKLASFLPLDIIPLNFESDGTFPHGIPNPLLPECRAETSQAVLANKADLGVAFDGDFDRCFFYDENGKFIEGYYIIGMLAAQLLSGRTNRKVIHDTRVYWNSREQILAAGGIPVMGKTGHAFMKERMRLENAIYGGEMSAHHYFGDFFFCDSGILAMLLVISSLPKFSRPFSEMLEERMAAFPCSGEINFKVDDIPGMLDMIWRKYETSALYTDKIDGINMEFDRWRFNLRASNTESLLRLNVESKGEKSLVEDKTEEICRLLQVRDY